MARILIIEDDKFTSQFLCDLICMSAKKRYQSEYPIQIDQVDNAADALKYIEARNYELVITDIMMARMDGYELIAEVRKDYDRAELPILVVTAIDGVDIKYDSIRRGATDGFAKPLKGEEKQRFLRVLFNLVMER